MLVNSGRDSQYRQTAGDVAGFTGTATAVAATTMTDSGQAWTTNAFTGHHVTLGSRYGVIVSNTATVLTIDQWYVPSTPGATAGSTPSTGVYIILPGAAPSWYLALTANSGAAAGADTTLTGEITTASGGLIRKLATVAHTAGVASYTVGATWTANGSDSLPVTVAKIGTFNTLPGATGVMNFETLINATATFSLSGDQATVTDTVTTS